MQFVSSQSSLFPFVRCSAVLLSPVLSGHHGHPDLRACKHRRRNTHTHLSRVLSRSSNSTGNPRVCVVLIAVLIQFSLNTSVASFDLVCCLLVSCDSGNRTTDTRCDGFSKPTGFFIRIVCFFLNCFPAFIKRLLPLLLLLNGLCFCLLEVPAVPHQFFHSGSAQRTGLQWTRKYLLFEGHLLRNIRQCFVNRLLNTVDVHRLRFRSDRARHCRITETLNESRSRLHLRRNRTTTAQITLLLLECLTLSLVQKFFPSPIRLFAFGFFLANSGEVPAGNLFRSLELLVRDRLVTLIVGHFTSVLLSVRLFAECRPLLSSLDHSCPQ